MGWGGGSGGGSGKGGGERGKREVGGGGGGRGGRGKRNSPVTRAVLVDFAHAFELEGTRAASVQIQDCVAGVDHILESLRLIRDMFGMLAC